MTQRVASVVQVGIGGYGNQYVNLLRPLRAEGRVALAGVIDPVADRAPAHAELASAGVPFWPDFGAFRATGIRPDLVVVCSPIQFHCEHACAALAQGLSVLCEKPVAGSLAEAERMDRARIAAGRLLAIGYQWSFARATQGLKADILAGRYGAPRRFSAWVAWPRSSAYFGRNGWAGRIADADGRPVWDSPVNNATAHHLHNLLYLLGDAVNRSARPVRAQAELYRANAIETFDAAALRVWTDRGVEVLFHTAHCVRESNEPAFSLDFERGQVRYQAGSGGIVGTFADGSVRDYGDPDADLPRKLLLSLESAVAGRDDTPCGIEAAIMHTRVVDALRRVPIHPLGDGIVARETLNPGDVLTFVPDLTATMRRCFERGLLFSEAGVPWAHAPETVSI